MEYRKLGNSGLKVPVLSFGTATFGGGNEFFKSWGNTHVEEAKRIVDICLEAGLNLFDTADVYSNGASEEILGQAILGKRHEVILSTKTTYPMGEGVHDYGSSRHRLIKAVEDSLRRLKTDHIDIYHMHGFDNHTPVEETLSALDDLVRSGKLRYIAASNFSGWQLMKSLAVSEKYGYSRYIGHQVYYSLVDRELESELIPLGADQGVGTIVWSPLAGGALSGKIRRNQPAPKDSRLGQIQFISYNEDVLYRTLDVLAEIAQYREKTIPQVALNWVLRRPTVSTVIIGARNESQLKQNLGAIGWKLSAEEVARLDESSQIPPLYPRWQQNRFPMLDSTFDPCAH